MSAQVENSITPARVQLDHLLLDHNFLHKAKIRAFKRLFGLGALLWLIDVMSMMSVATNAEIERESALDAAECWGLTNGEEIINYCSAKERQILIALPNGRLSNQRVMDDQEACALKRDKWRTSKRQQRGQSEDIPKTTVGHSGGPLNTEDLNTEDLDHKEDSPPLHTQLPENLVWVDEFLEAPTSQRVLKSNLFINMGKRPMKKYRKIWLQPTQLADTVQRYEMAGIPKEHLRFGFEYVAAQIEKHTKQGKPIEKIDAFGWLIGYGLTEAQRQYEGMLKIQRNKNYLNGTGAK